MAEGRKQSGTQRSDRLYAITRILRDGALHKGRDLADRLGVSERTIWRDMATLRASGIPVEGERGVGYLLTAPITLPPMNLTMGELEALHLAVAILGEATDPDLSGAAQSLAAKIDAVLPENSGATGAVGPSSAGWGFAVYPFADAAAGFRHLPLLRDAVREKKRVRITYLGHDDTPTTRVVRPLQLDYWGRVWTMGAWCELREDFRVFRVDRIEKLIDTGATFNDDTGKSLQAFLTWKDAAEEAENSAKA